MGDSDYCKRIATAAPEKLFYRGAALGSLAHVLMAWLRGTRWQGWMLAGLDLAALTLPQLAFIAIAAGIVVLFFVLVGRTMKMSGRGVLDQSRIVAISTAPAGPPSVW